MTKILLILFIGMFLVSFVGAQENPTFEFNKQFDLKRACSDNGFFCSNSFVCNITLLYPDGSLLRNNIIMTDSTSYRNVTISQQENNQLGFIKAMESCNNGTNAGLETFDIAITADGKKFQKFPQEFVIIILALFFVIIGLMNINERLNLFKHLGSILLLIMGVLTLYPGYAFINWTTLMGKGIGFTLIALGFYYLIEGSFSRTEQANRYEQDFEEDD